MLEFDQAITDVFTSLWLDFLKKNQELSTKLNHTKNIHKQYESECDVCALSCPFEHCCRISDPSYSIESCNVGIPSSSEVHGQGCSSSVAEASPSAAEAETSSSSAEAETSSPNAPHSTNSENMEVDDKDGVEVIPNLIPESLPQNMAQHSDLHMHSVAPNKSDLPHGGLRITNLEMKDPRTIRGDWTVPHSDCQQLVPKQNDRDITDIPPVSEAYAGVSGAIIKSKEIRKPQKVNRKRQISVVRMPTLDQYGSCIWAEKVEWFTEKDQERCRHDEPIRDAVLERYIIETGLINSTDVMLRCTSVRIIELIISNDSHNNCSLSGAGMVGYGRLVLPLIVGNHIILVMVIAGNRCVQIADPDHSDRSNADGIEAMITTLMNILFPDCGELEAKFVECPQQRRGSNDCGPFVASFICQFFMSKNFFDFPSFIMPDAVAMRGAIRAVVDAEPKIKLKRLVY